MKRVSRAKTNEQAAIEPRQLRCEIRAVLLATHGPNATDADLQRLQDLQSLHQQWIDEHVDELAAAQQGRRERDAATIAAAEFESAVIRDAGPAAGQVAIALMRREQEKRRLSEQAYNVGQKRLRAEFELKKAEQQIARIYDNNDKAQGISRLTIPSLAAELSYKDPDGLRPHVRQLHETGKIENLKYFEQWEADIIRQYVRLNGRGKRRAKNE